MARVSRPSARESVLIGLLVVSLLFSGASLKVALHASGRLTADEQKTCKVQAIGLPAGKHLAQVMIGINEILAPVDRARLGASQLPAQPPTPLYYQPALKRLRYHLPRYNALEARQLGGRSC